MWLTGLSGSGKSTLANALEVFLLQQRIVPIVFDGDALRTGLSQGLGFSATDREENVRRATEVALLSAAAGLVAVVALISPFRAGRKAAAEAARSRGIPFAEIFVNAPLATCERRDPKGLYQKARRGQLTGWTGVDSPYEPPAAPDLELHTDSETVADSLAKLGRLTLALAQPAGSFSGARAAAT